MPRPVPPPVAAAIGLLPAALDGVRRVPGKAVQLPVLAISHVLTTMENVKRDYADLADRGQRVVATLRGTSFDALEDKAEDALAGTPLAAPYDRVEDALEDTVDRVKQAGNRAATTLRAAPDLASDLASELSAVPAAEQAKAGATPRSAQPDATRPDTAAAPSVVKVVEQVAATVGAGAVTSHDDLPLPDYDHMTLGSLRGRIRSLDVASLVQVRDYEKAHADRLPVVTLLDNRIAKLAASPAAPAAAPSPDPAISSTAAKGKVGGPAKAKTTAPRTKVRTT